MLSVPRRLPLTQMAFMTLLSVAAAACDKVPLLAPSNSTISMSAGSRILVPGDSTSVTALIIEPSGTPVQNGTTVRFTTSLGTVSPAEAQTKNGAAVTTFSAGSRSGVAEVRATSGGAGIGGAAPPAGGAGGTGGSSSSSGSNVIEILIGTATATDVVVRASNPIPLPGQTITITAVVTDTFGNSVEGVPVTFTTTSGSLSPNAATTDATGSASVNLTTFTNATVTATVGGNFGTVTVTVQ